jgi:mRNA-degrading endonuclease RelE of RelBE toxin-antitoxin system
MPYNGLMFEFIETASFTKILEQYLDDDEYSRLQNHLNNHPESGVIVPGSGGVRKLRWRGEGRGKRGGLRLIYYLASSGRDLDADDLWKECAGEHPRAFAQGNERGN